MPPGHLAHFVIDAVEALDLRTAKVNACGTGDEQFPPAMLLALLVYSSATGPFGSRRIERSTHDSVPVRLITADTHPDHDTICTFRRENKALLAASFGQVLQLAQQVNLLKVGQLTVAADGPKVVANASKHAAGSYERAGERVAQLELEVRQLLAQAEAADAPPLEDGLEIPAEITRRQERKAALAQARAEIEARAPARPAAELAEHEQKRAERQARQARGEKVAGRPSQAPSPAPQPTAPYNFTAPESRILKAGPGEPFEQAYNAQAGTEVESRLIVGARVRLCLKSFLQPPFSRGGAAHTPNLPRRQGGRPKVRTEKGSRTRRRVAPSAETAPAPSPPPAGAPPRRPPPPARLRPPAAGTSAGRAPAG